jgi:hypothetical protein
MRGAIMKALYKILSKFNDESAFTLLCDEPFSEGEIACFKSQNNLSYDVHKNAWLDKDEFAADDTFEYQFMRLGLDNKTLIA